MPLAGQKVRASDIRNVNAVFKAAGESVTSSTAAQNDDDIAIALDVGTWAIDLWAVISTVGSSTPGVGITWTNTGTMTLRHRSGSGPTHVAATTDVRNASGVFRAGMALSTTPGYGADGNADTTRSTRVHEHLVLEVTVAGTITMRWAQGTSNATATSMTTQTHAMWQQVDEQ